MTFLLLKNIFCVKIIIGDMMEQYEIDNEFIEIEKKDYRYVYIVVAFLYLIIIVLSIFLILGLKKQKDTVKNSISNNNITLKQNNK